MFPNSSQRRYWTFKNEQEILELRQKHNQEFHRFHGDRLGLTVSIFKHSYAMVLGDWRIE